MGKWEQEKQAWRKQQECRSRALRNLRIESELRAYEYKIEAVRTGEEVLAAAGLTFQDIAVDPRHLFLSDAYEGGNALRFDPFHRATSWLLRLRFADHDGNPDSIHGAIIQASKALREHGVPSEIADAYAIDARAEEFSVQDVLAVMPVLTDAMGWLDRAEGALGMIGALVGVPGDYHARDVIREYTWHLTVPGVHPVHMQNVFEEKVRAALDPYH